MAFIGEAANELPWDLLENQSSQVLTGLVDSRSADDFLVLHKLDNVLAASFDGHVVTIKSDHVGEVLITDSDDNDGHGQVARGDVSNLVDGLVHVVDLSVSKDQQDMEHLAVLARHHLLGSLADHLGEAGRSQELELGQTVLVLGEHSVVTVNASDLGVLRVAVEGEAVRDVSLTGVDVVGHSAESVDRILVVRIIVTKNLTDRL